MKKDWEIKTLGEVCGFQNGYAFQSKTYKNNGTPVLRITNIQNGTIDLSNLVYVDRDDYNKDLSQFEVNKNDILIAMSGATTGKIGKHISDEILLLNQRVGKFIPNTNFINKQFLFHFLSTKVEESLKISLGSAQPNLNTIQIKKFQIPLPPLAEQEKIVEILDNAFDSIDKAKANLEKNILNANELFQSELNSIFSQKGDGWEEKTLGEVCESTKNIKWSDFPNKEFKYIDLSSVSLDTYDIYETSIVNQNNAPSRAKKIIEKGDVLFATTRPTLKRVTLIDDEFDGDLCSTGFSVLRVKKGIEPKWIFYYLLTDIFMLKMEKLQRGASYPAVTDKDVKGSELIIPKSIQTQEEIVERLKKVDNITKALIDKYKKKLANLEELKKSILEKAFAGELT